MAAGRIFEIAFAINATMQGGFSAAMNQAGRSMQLLGSAAMTANQQFAQGQQKAAAYLSTLKGTEANAQKFKTLQNSIQATNARLSAAETSANRLSAAFMESKAATARLKSELDRAKNAAAQMKGKMSPEAYQAARAEISRLSNAYKENQARTKALQKEYNAAQSEVTRLNRNLTGQRDALNQTKQSLAAAGFSVDNFTESEKKLRAEIEKTEAAQKRAAATQAALARQQAARQAAQTNYQMAQTRFSDAKAGMTSAAMNVAMVAAPVMGMIETAAEFEATMSKVKAITGATGADFDKLTAKARELGEKTQFSARQSAEAMTYLGMAGWKTQEILDGMPGLLSLAAAGGTDLARTADIISDDLTAFGLTADKAGHMADVFATTITTTNTNVEMLGETMKYAAPVAHGFGISLEDTAALAGLMANGAIKASQAGTSLRAGLLRLAGPPKKASAALDEMGMSLDTIYAEQREAAGALKALGIEMEDVKGPRKMSAILTELRQKTADLSEEQKLSTLGAIFGTNAASGWLNVINAGPEAFDALVASLEHCDGAAEKIADTMNDNAKGAATRLKSAMESLSISIGNGFLPAVADAADSAAMWAGSMSRWATQHPKTTQTIMQLGAALVGLYAYIKITSLASAGYALITSAMNASTIAYVITSKSFSVATKLAAVAQWALNAAMAANPVGLVIAGIAALIGIGYLLISNWETVKAFFVGFWESPLAAIAAFAAAGPLGVLVWAASLVIANWETVKAWFILLWNDPEAALTQFIAAVKAKFTDCVQWIEDKWNRLKFILGNPITAAVNFIETGSVSGTDSSLAGVSADYTPGESAEGGIFKRPYLTWVAEGKAAEAIVPLDGSKRAVSLWEQAGRMLGLIPSPAMEAGRMSAAQKGAGGAEPSKEPGRNPSIWEQAGQMLGLIPTIPQPRSFPESAAPGRESKLRTPGLWEIARDALGIGGQDRERPARGGGVYGAAPAFAGPPITISLTFNGPADAREVQAAVTQSARTVQRSWAEEMADFMRERERGSYA